MSTSFKFTGTLLTVQKPLSTLLVSILRTLWLIPVADEISTKTLAVLVPISPP
jgi:hypothetical protein